MVATVGGSASDYFEIKLVKGRFSWFIPASMFLPLLIVLDVVVVARRHGRHQTQDQGKRAHPWIRILLRLVALWICALVATALCLSAIGRTQDFPVVATLVSILAGSFATGGAERRSDKSDCSQIEPDDH